MEALAWIAASQRQHERAAVLLGAAAGLLRSMGTTLDGYQPLAGFQRDCERQARQALGEAAFRAAWHRGLDLPAEDAVAYALQQPPDKPPEPRPPAGPAAPLTRRELQVARLVAGGRSNKEIAAELVIAQRTAEGHVERILAKLGFTSRAQVAAWVAASQPDGEGRLRGPETIRPRNSSTDWSRRSMTSENNWFGEVLAARTSGNAGPDVPYGQLSASENRDPGLRRRRWS